MSTQSSPFFFAEDDLLSLSALADLVFCERRAALHQIEGIWEDNPFTVEGTYLHEKADTEDHTEVRGDLRIARGLRLRSLILGLSGKADVVEFHRVSEREAGIQLENAPGIWQPFPVEYKRGRLRSEESFEVQLCAQALCLEEMLNTQVPCGALYYGQTRRRLEIPFDGAIRGQTEAAAQRLHELVQAGVTPPAQYGPKCESCSLINICLPKSTGHRGTVQRYLARTIGDLTPDPFPKREGVKDLPSQNGKG